MSSITTHYGIDGPIAFEDVDVDADNRLYVDPHAIRLSRGPQPFQQQAVDCMDSFFHEVTRCVLEGTPAAQARGEKLLQEFFEPWETRLGMAKTGFQGHGGASIVGTRIWAALRDDVDALIEVGILRRIEQLPLFIEGVDRDITSDVTTRIIFEALGRFTESMIEQHPEFTSGKHVVKTFVKQVWNPGTQEWDTARITLPVVNGKALLLVPRGWARPTLLMSATRYYETSVLTYAQLQQAVLSSDGKLLTSRKDDLKKQRDLSRGRATNLRLTQRAVQQDENLLEHFESFVARQLRRQSTTRNAA
ncbi:hypothetical protein [Pseudoclavibacter helvolus]|uniref:hypothetical protein n=1 Tax=Pseudoclavibacter helvolus TaxID=255205 RepID=UPI0008390D53|nr:hypothetical protein [Pseudoclavibacter helvolus]